MGILTEEMRRTAAVYSLIALFVGSERFLRQRKAATSLQESASDAGSTRAIGSALGISAISLLLAPILNVRSIAALPGRRLPFCPCSTNDLPRKVCVRHYLTIAGRYQGWKQS